MKPRDIGTMAIWWGGALCIGMLAQELGLSVWVAFLAVLVWCIAVSSWEQWMGWSE